MGVSAWIGGGLALVLGCSESDALVPAGAMPSAGAPSTAPTSVEVVPAQTTASEGTATAPTQATPEPECASSYEFHSLGVVPDNYDQSWSVLAPDSSYAYWNHSWSGNDVRVDSFRWTAAGGVQILDVQAEPEAQDIDLFFELVSSDGATVLGTRYADQPSVDGFRWTRETGMSWLDFEPVAMTPDAKLAVGFREGVPVRWIEGVGTTEIDPTWSAMRPMLQYMALSRTGDVVLASDYFSGRSFRWTETTGSTDLGRLERAPSKTVAYYMSQSGDVIAGTAGNYPLDQSRAVRWTEASGLQDLGDAPGAAEGSAQQVSGISADGSTIVGQITTLDGVFFSHTFRWTEATGMQDITPGDRSAQVRYLSPDGQVVIGYYSSSSGSASGGFRWTAATGAVDVTSTTPLGIGADGDLLVGNSLQGPSIETFGKLAGTTPDLVRLSGSSLLPGGWTEPRLDGVSRDGGLLVGEGLNPSGQWEPWLMHLIKVCPGQ